MSKLGRPFEQAVADVVAAVDPNSTVQQGKWIVGPDGRRECDVLCEGSAGANRWRLIFECKDYDPKRMGPIGIKYVDALDSKRRDLGCNGAFICSNAGFTADAIRKARRVGIGLVSVLRKGDPRVRHAIVDEIYTRRLRVLNISVELRLEGEPVSLPESTADHITLGDNLLASWVRNRIAMFLVSNFVVRGSFAADHKLKCEQTLYSGAAVMKADHIRFRFSFTGTWVAHIVRIDASSGMYDWIRRRVKLSTGLTSIEYGDLDVYSGTRIHQPPDLDQLARQVAADEIDIRLMMIHDFGSIAAVPTIDALVEPQDLDLRLPIVPIECQTSDPQFADA